jgi:pimeloyl-ACP methyl ester carboxylesterase
MSDAETEGIAEFGTDLVRVQIKMNRSFTNFTSDLKRHYLSELAIAAGCTPETFLNSIFIRGCVKHEFEVPRAIAQRLAKLFELAEKSTPEDANSEIESELEKATLKQFMEFVSQHFISDVKIYKTITVRVTDNAPRKVAIFVHGWRGTGDSFGRTPEWIQALTGWRTGVFSYPTGLWGNSPSISLVANSLDNWIRANFESSTIAIIGHSMGGVAVRKMLTEQVICDDPLDVRLAVMCASPHTGALASLMRKIPTLDSAQLRELDQDSTFLFDLNKYWNWWINKKMVGQVTTKSIIAQEDGVVSLNSAMGLDPSPLVVLGADHRSVVKPSSDKDLAVQRLANWINAI